jgi:hypothetical protein
MNSNTARIRSLYKAIEEIKTEDPNTSLSLHGLKTLAENGQISTVKVGNRTYVEMNQLMDELSSGRVGE